MTPRALTIAGSDVSGGAGIEADLKMFQESGVFGAAVLTCIVTFDPENDFGHALDFMEPDTVQRQLDSTLAVHRFDVLKSGMLGSVESALVLAERLRTNELPYVFDPVLVCKGAGTMVDLKDLFVENLVPLAHVITPNLEEAATLTGADALTSVDEMAEAARAIHAQGATNVVIKGGARLAGDEAIDVLFDGETLTTFSSPKIEEHLVNGAGCSFASTVAAEIAHGRPVADAVANAKQRITRGIATSLDNAIGVDSLFFGGPREGDAGLPEVTRQTR